MADEEEKPEKQGVTAAQVCVKILKFIFSTAGLLVINIIFMFVGAFLFEHLEKHNEQLECFSSWNNYNRTEEAAVTLLLDIDVRVRNGALQVDGGKEIIQNDYARVLRAFSQNVLSVGFNVSKDCNMMGLPGGPAYKWSTSGALTFALTIGTTIGYGHISPSTTWGKWVCLAYAIVALPLMLAFVANVGAVMANMVKYIYATVCCCGCCRKKTRKEVEGDDVVTAWKTDSAGRPIGPVSDYDEEDYDELDDEEKLAEISVPLTISLAVIVVFLLFGAGLFTVWEDWNFIDAVYFCFITFSTIGFGDMVPGTTNLDSPDSKIQLAVTGVYQVFAIAVLSMCFQMMIDELMAKFKWLGEKIKDCKKSKNEIDVGNGGNEARNKAD